MNESKPIRKKGKTAPPKPSDRVRVLIVDDSLTVRTIFSRMIEMDSALELIGTASNAERALAMLRTRRADVVLLDLEMPGMGGLEALPKLLAANPETKVLVVSSLTEDGAEHTLKALAIGAADTMLKPRPGGFNDEYRSALLGKIKALGGSAAELDAQDTAKSAAKTGARTKLPDGVKRPRLLAIGGSTGGIHALNILLRDLPESFDLPIVITQHLPSSFVPVFARQVEIASGRRTLIGDEGTSIKAGEVVIANATGHMLVREGMKGLIAATSIAPARSGCMPSLDPMLESLAENLDGHALAVVLSGMGRDGADGAQKLVNAGGAIIAQDAETSAVWGMPGAIANAGLASAILPPDAMTAAIMAMCGSASWK